MGRFRDAGAARGRPRKRDRFQVLADVLIYWPDWLIQVKQLVGQGLRRNLYLSAFIITFSYSLIFKFCPDKRHQVLRSKALKRQLNGQSCALLVFKDIYLEFCIQIVYSFHINKQLLDN